MQYTLENDDLKITVASFGAELQSVADKKSGRDYMWYADKTYWGRTSPVLFPFVGSLQEKAFLYKGKSYPMGQHGFARDMEHTLLSQTEDTLWFVLKSTSETLEKYPFPFELRIGYQLRGRSVKVLWEVMNPSGSQLPFSIGAHPAFLCPIHGEQDKAGYQLSFERFAAPSANTASNIRIDADASLTPAEEIHHHGNTRDTGLALREDILLPLENGICTITKDFFDRCTYMIEGGQANAVSILDPSGKPYVSILFDTPLFAIWSPEEKNAPFLCIEPWYGRCDQVDFHGELTEREYTNHLAGGDTFHAEYVMKFAALS